MSADNHQIHMNPYTPTQSTSRWPSSSRSVSIGVRSMRFADDSGRICRSLGYSEPPHPPVVGVSVRSSISTSPQNVMNATERAARACVAAEGRWAVVCPGGVSGQRSGRIARRGCYGQSSTRRLRLSGRTLPNKSLRWFHGAAALTPKGIIEPEEDIRTSGAIQRPRYAST